MNNETLCAIARQLLKQQQASNSSIVEGLLPTCSPDIDLFIRPALKSCDRHCTHLDWYFYFQVRKVYSLGKIITYTTPAKLCC